MADTKFTALGLSGSGKTCYLLGMYYEMCVGINGFTLVTTNEAASKLERWMDQLDDEVGQDRFPSGTSLTEFTNYCFELNYYNESIMAFDWADYGGRTIEVRENNPKVFTKLSNSIKESTALYIFIDGELLCDEEKGSKNIQKQKRKLNNSIDAFVKSHNNEDLPPIVFVITKFDLCNKENIKENEIIDILKKKFSDIFAPGRLIYVVPVSLGNEISDDDYSGEVEPVNIHIPFFIGIFHEFGERCVGIKEEILKEEQENRNQISQNINTINHEKKKWFFTRHKKIDRCEKKIQDAETKIKSCQESLKKYRKLLTAVSTELSRTSSAFKVFSGSEEKNFSPVDIVSEI